MKERYNLMRKGEFSVVFYGDHASFINPIFKAEGFTYPVITPSAARGMFEAIYWKPEMHWEIRKIKILSKIQTYPIMQNIIKDPAPKKGKIEKTQRNQVFIHNPKYEITAEIIPHDNDIIKHEQIFLRRLEKKLNYHQPYFGIRELIADYYKSKNNDLPVDINMKINGFLFDMTFGAKNEPIFWDAEIKNGILNIPPEYYSKMNFGDIYAN